MGGMGEYLRWEWDVLRQAGRNLKRLVGKTGLVSELVVAAGFAVLAYVRQGPNPSMMGAAADGLMAAGVLAIAACVFAVVSAPYRLHASERDTLDRLVSEELDVDMTLAMYTDVTFINVHNNEDTDEFVCEVVAWGNERPLSRSHFPWKVKWKDHEGRFCTIAKGTSERLFLAKINRDVADDTRPSEPRPRKSVTVVFMTPSGEKLHGAFSYLDAESFEMRKYYLRLLVSAKGQSKATKRTLEVRVTHTRENEAGHEYQTQKPILRTRFVG